MASFPVKVQNLDTRVQIVKKRPPMKFQDRLQFLAAKDYEAQNRKLVRESMPARPFNKVLDGALLTYSCRVKHAWQAIKSRVNGECIVDVKEDDLLEFQNLTHLDISDNQVQINQLKNLLSLQELDIQYNNLTFLQIFQNSFVHLHSLNLSYNKIPPGHLAELGHLQNLQVLELASNDLCTLPTDLSFLRQVTHLNLASNNFSSDSMLVSASQLFRSLSTIPQLRKLNLSRNRLVAFHSEALPHDNLSLRPPQQAFSQLQELDISFNLVHNQSHLFYCPS